MEMKHAAQIMDFKASEGNEYQGKCFAKPRKTTSVEFGCSKEEVDTFFPLDDTTVHRNLKHGYFIVCYWENVF